MKLTAYRNSQSAYNFFLFVIAFSFLIVWLPLIRSAFDGDTYEWGTRYFTFFFGGKGVTADYLFLIVQLIFYAFFFLSVYWIKDRRIFYGLTAVWWIHFFGSIIFEIANSEDAVFRGDTLGVEVPLIYIITPVALIALGLVIRVISLDLKGEKVQIAWSKRNRLIAWIIFGPLPIQFALLRFGEHISLMDQIGVMITITQCMLIPLVIRPYLQKEN